MKKILLVLLVVLLLSTTAVTAAEMRKGISVGAAVGAPFTFVVVTDYNFGVASAALSLGYVNLGKNFGAFEVGLEGNYNLPFTLATENKSIVLYPSVGGRVDLQFATGGITFVNIGGVLGLNYLLKSFPVKIFAKALPHFQIATKIFRLNMRGEVGVLYSF